jgi:signal transduction histidine kinase
LTRRIKLLAQIDRLPFRAKIAAAMLTAALTALLAASVIFVYLQYRAEIAASYKIQYLTTQGVASILAAPVSQGDTDETLRVLKQLEAVETIRKVVVADRNGRPVITMKRVHDVRTDFRATTKAPIMWKGVMLGEVRLTAIADLSASPISEYVKAVAIIIIALFGMSLFLATAMSAILFRPLRAMTMAMERIRDSRDYSARVELMGDEETRGVIDTLNAMLDEVERRDNELAEAALALAAARDQAQKASAAKSQFLANMSHELRTPLNAIIGYADVLKQDLTEQNQTQLAEDAGWIDGSARHLLGMINELLDMAKIEAGRMEVDLHEVNVSEVLEDIRSTLEPLAQINGNTLEMRVAGDVGNGLMDSVKLRQCLLNLGGNACKFTRDGHVVISARAIVIGRRDWIEITVSDSGIGMTSEEVERLFEPFAQADSTTTRRFGGTGLGLAITARLVEIMGARLTVDSVPGVGSAFRLRLPRDGDAAPAGESWARGSMNHQPNRENKAA